jgi:hypothetical protein
MPVCPPSLLRVLLAVSLLILIVAADGSIVAADEPSARALQVYCHPGFEPGAYGCYPCAPGFFKGVGSWIYDATKCSPCPAGSSTLSLSAATSCTPCAPNSASVSGQGACTSSCPPGTGFVTGGNPLACSPCPRNMFQSGAGIQCANCPIWTHAPTTSTAACPPCPAGFVCPVAGQDPVPCPRGSFKPSPGVGACVACPLGLVSADRATSCSPCQAGHVLVSPSSPGLPPLTLSSAVSANGTVCAPCQRGSYLLQNSTACVACPLGLVSADGASTCGSCPAGQVLVSSSTPGLPQQPSSSAVGPNGTFCAPCPADTLPIASGLATLGVSIDAACQPCPANRFSALGSSVCGSICGEGHFVRPNGTCAACPAGTRQPAGLAVTSCIRCDAGFISSQAGSTACFPCGDAGLSLVSSSDRSRCVSSCLDKEMPNNATDLCEPCSPGFWCTGGMATQCQDVDKCLGGNVCEPTRSGVGCIACAARYFRSGGDECSPCPAVPWRIVVTGVVFFLILVVGPVLFCCLSPSAKVIATSIFRGESLHTLRLLGQRLMMLSGLSEASHARWPDPFSIYFFFPVLTGLRLDAADLACVSGMSFAFTWGVAVSVPILVVLLSVAVQVWAASASRREVSGMKGGATDEVAGESGSGRRRWRRPRQSQSRAEDIVRVAQAAIAVVAPFLAAHGIRPFVCSQGVDGEAYLVAEPSLPCTSSVVASLQVVGGFVLVLALLAGAASLWWRCTEFQEDSGDIGIDAVRELEFIDFVVSVFVSVISEATAALTAKDSPVGLSLLFVLVALSAGTASCLFPSGGRSISYTRSFFITRVSAGLCDIMVISVGLYLQAIRRHNVSGGVPVELSYYHLLALGWMLLLAALPHSISIVFMFGAAVREAVTWRPFDWERPRRGHKAMTLAFGLGSFIVACVAFGTSPNDVIPSDAKIGGILSALAVAFAFRKHFLFAGLGDPLRLPPPTPPQGDLPLETREVPRSTRSIETEAASSVGRARRVPLKTGSPSSDSSALRVVRNPLAESTEVKRERKPMSESDRARKTDEAAVRGKLDRRSLDAKEPGRPKQVATGGPAGEPTRVSKVSRAREGTEKRRGKERDAELAAAAAAEAEAEAAEAKKAAAAARKQREKAAAAAAQLAVSAKEQREKAAAAARLVVFAREQKVKAAAAAWDVSVRPGKEGGGGSGRSPSPPS